MKEAEEAKTGSKSEQAKFAMKKKEMMRKVKNQVEAKKADGNEDYDDIECMQAILDPPQKFEVAEAFSQLFKMNKTLMHVDLSQNNFNEKDCKVMAEGLDHNHSILGIHFVGNKFDIDAFGFMRPDGNSNPSSGHLVT